MQIETSSETHQPDVEAGRARTDAGEGLFGAGYLRRVYRTTGVAWAVLALLLLAHFGLSAFIGLSVGAAIAVGSLWVLEMTVLYLLHPGLNLTPRRIAVLLNLKLPALTVLLAGAMWAVTSGVANVFALFAGISLVQLVIVLKAVGAWLLTILPPVDARAFSRQTVPALPRDAFKAQLRAAFRSKRRRISAVWRLASGD
jgi:hypothetical protein